MKYIVVAVGLSGLGKARSGIIHDLGDAQIKRNNIILREQHDPQNVYVCKLLPNPK